MHASHDPAAPLSLMRRSSLAAALATLVLFFSTLHFPAVPAGRILDETWQILLTQAHLQGWRFGKDVVFTYGPLGVFENNIQLPALYWPQLLWQFFSRLAAALLLVRLMLRLPGWLAWASPGLAALLFTTHRGLNPPDPYLLLVILTAGLTLLETTAARPWRWLALIVLTTFALIKFTLFMAAGFAVMIAVCEQVRRRNMGCAAILGCVYVSGFFAFWKLLGQSWADLPGWLRWSYEVADGYVDAMQLRESWKGLLAALLSASCLFGFALLALRMRQAARQHWPALLLTTGCLYLAWRHGTVRGDQSHLPGLFCATAVWPWLLLARRDKNADFPRLAALAAGLTLVSSVCLAKTGALRIKAHDLVENLAGNVTTLASPFHAHALWLAAMDQSLAKLDAQISTSQWLPHSTVGVYACDYTSLALRPGIKPPPSLQAYSAYTPALAQRDREAFLGQAPDLLFVDLATIDSRLAAGEHLRLLTIMLRDYHWVENVDHYLLLRRSSSTPLNIPPKPEPIATLPSVRFGESLPMATYASAPVQLDAEIELTPLGRILRFFSALPSIKLKVIQGESGQMIDYRLTWRLAGEGLAIYPFISSNEDMERWMRAGQTTPVQKITFDAVAAHLFYHEPFKVTLRPLAVPVPMESAPNHAP